MNKQVIVAAIKPITVVNIILGAILLGMLINKIYLTVVVKKSAKLIDQEEFKEKMRHGQVIDVREKEIFNDGHILGARCIPYPLLKESYTAIRKDQPVLLYDQKKALSTRAANILRKKGYTDIYILKGGYNKWTGKMKKEKAY